MAKAGALVLPKTRQISVQLGVGRTAKVDAAYGTIINPGVTKLPHGLLRVAGDPSNPSGLVYPKHSRVPGAGAVLVVGPSSRLPYGLIARVTARHAHGSTVLLSIVNVPLSAAVPEFSFTGAADLHPAARASAAARNPASPCGPGLFDVGAELDQFQIRQASAQVWTLHPQLSLEVAARTTEHAGARAQVVGLSCTWTLATLGPWRGGIPAGPIIIPVYADVPITANVDIGGSLAAFQINLASTHDMKLDLGHYNHFSLQEQGSNVWTSGSLGWTDQATLGLNLSVQVGIGDPRLGNFHLDVGIGAAADFATDQTCELDLIPGSLDAGTKIGPLHGTLNLWSANPYPLWHGCTGSGGGGGGGSGSPSITTTSLPAGAVGTAYSQTLQASGGSPPYVWSISTGSLPSGLTLSSNGTITGTPTTVGASSFTVRLTDAAGKEASRAFTIDVAGGAYGLLGSVSCASAGNCSAVGSSEPDGHGLLLAETNGTWQPGADPPLPANASALGESGLASVYCASPGNCSAVGAYLDTSAIFQGLLLTEANGTWQPGAEASLPADAAPNSGVEFFSLSCGSAGNCSAVGLYKDGSGDIRGLLLTEANGVWQAGVEPSLPANAASPSQVWLNSVSCASAGNCSAVGSYTDSSGNTQGLLLTETNGTWQTGLEASLPVDVAYDGASISSVSCASTGNCSAVGWYFPDGPQPQGLLLSETNGTWQTGVEASLPADAAAFYVINLFSVSCGSAGNCSAVGQIRDSSGVNTRGLLLTEANGVWQPGVEPSLPANAASPSQSYPYSVSCASAGNCSAVGEYADSSGNELGLLLSETNGTWQTGVQASLPAGPAAPPVILNSVSCGSAGNCSAVGFYGGSLGYTQGLLLSEIDGVWGGGTRVSPTLDAAHS